MQVNRRITRARESDARAAGPPFLIWRISETRQEPSQIFLGEVGREAQESRCKLFALRHRSTIAESGRDATTISCNVRWIKLVAGIHWGEQLVQEAAFRPCGERVVACCERGAPRYILGTPPSLHRVRRPALTAG